MTTAVKTRDRDLSLDLLRITACLMVICIHVVIEGWYDTSPRTYAWTVLNFYDTLSRPAVPVFFMISGALFLRKDHIDPKKLWLKSILRISLIYLVWALFYAFTNDGLHKTLADPAAAIQIVFGPHPQYHLWYLRALLNLYAIAPLLWLLVRAMDRKAFHYFLAVFFVFGVICKTVYELPHIPSWLHEQILMFVDMDLVGHSAYFMLGYFLSDSELIQKYTRKILTIVYIVTVLLAAALNQWISWVDNWPTEALYGHFSLPVVVEAVCLFMLFRKTFAGWKPEKKWISLILRVSESTLFVYLIHVFVIRRLQIYLHLYVMIYNVLFSVPLMVLLVFVLSSVCGMVLKRIPVIRRFL